MPNAAAIAAIQSRHRFELGQLHDAHRGQHDHLRRQHAQAREREREEATAHASVPPKRAGQHAPRVRDDDTYVRDRVTAHAELDAKQRTQREDMVARHKHEIAAERTRPTSSAGPDRHSGPAGPGALGAVWSDLSAAQQAQYHALKQKFADQRTALDTRRSQRECWWDQYRHQGQDGPRPRNAQL